MSYSLHHSQQFNGAHQQDGLQYALHPQLPLKPKEQLANTNAFTGENQSFLYQHLARIQVQDLSKHDISFQKNFLDIHIKTIERILQNSEESISKAPNQLKLTSQEVDNSLNLCPDSRISLLSFLETHQLASQLTESDQLIKDLEKEHDLSDLISYFINTYRKELAIRLVILTADIWSSVRHIKFRDLEIQDLHRRAHQWVKTNTTKYLQRTDSQAFIDIFKPSKGNLLQNTAEQNYANRLKIFSTTVLLVVSGFFQNPYADSQLPPQLWSEVDYPKRQSPCQSFGFYSCSYFFSEEDQEGEPQKKHKRF